MSRVNEILKEKRTQHEGLSREYLELFSRQNPTALKIWKGWRESYSTHSRNFGMYILNNPNGESDRWLIFPVEEFEQRTADSGFSKETRLALSNCIDDPDTLEREKIPPPTVVTWFDKETDWDFSVQFVGCPMKSKKGFG
jgi:hypothetical protein